jgi:hypothetical protein
LQADGDQPWFGLMKNDTRTPKTGANRATVVEGASAHR